MTFVQHTKPCGTCPFLKARSRFFRRGRADDIVKHHEADGHFLCHKHLKQNTGHLCAGSLIVAEKSGMHPSQMARVQTRLGLLDWSKVEHEVDTNTNVYDDMDAFKDAQEDL